MYLKVYYVVGWSDPEKDFSEKVREALPTDMEGLTVDMFLGYPCVNFPKDASYSDLKRVQGILREQGFETED